MLVLYVQFHCLPVIPDKPTPPISFSTHGAFRNFFVWSLGNISLQFFNTFIFNTSTVPYQWCTYSRLGKKYILFIMPYFTAILFDYWFSLGLFLLIDEVLFILQRDDVLFILHQVVLPAVL